ncbi:MULTISPECIES: MFS transporter [Enterococcus]|uniref:MFS transporter n=1 Tax=Enterococcus alishanensis TaxID=1303817 RepID=A0ABS6TEG7_9ENTE|nr:MFS transporter [Enterococcus alishanensis]MBV7391288.1 MFS transporter [Enterococcus alishanensis]
MNKASVKKYGTLLLLAAGAGIIFQLPYIRETFYVPIQQAMNLSNAQMGMLSSGYATMATVSYFIGGIVADKFSARKLLTISFLATGLLGIWFSTFPSFNTARLIFVLMGISTIITYWSAMIKATRMLGDSSEQGRLFGLQEGLRGILNAILVFGMTAVYGRFANEILGTAWAIRTCAIVVIIIGILNWFIIEDTDKEENAESFSEVIIGTFKQLAIPRVWLLVMIVFFGYSLYGIFGYINTLAINIYGLSVAGGATLGGTRYVIQAFGGIIGGLLADKIGSRIKVIVGGATLTALSYGLFLILPADKGLLTIILGNFVAGMFFIYLIRSQYFAIIDDAGIPVSKTGRVSGIVSCLGYLPDVFMYTMIGGWLDNNSGKTGFNMMFIYAIVMAVGCIIACLVLAKVIQKNKVEE